MPHWINEGAVDYVEGLITDTIAAGAAELLVGNKAGKFVVVVVPSSRLFVRNLLGVWLDQRSGRADHRLSSARFQMATPMSVMVLQARRRDIV